MREVAGYSSSSLSAASKPKIANEKRDYHRAKVLEGQAYEHRKWPEIVIVNCRQWKCEAFGLRCLMAGRCDAKFLCHTYNVCDRISFHLEHHLTSMDFNCLFTGTQL
jgi:hypothetical protein